MSPARAGRPLRPRRSRAGRVRLWIPLFGLAGCIVWLAEVLTGEVAACGLTMVDTRRARLAPSAGFADARWEDGLRARLARVSQLSALDREGIESVSREIANLPFVAEVGEPRVLWPDGFELPVRLREPAACVRAGGVYLAVSQDGVLLPGSWSVPPRVDGRVLPVIGPNDGSFDALPPGSRLAERRHRDALAVAISMRAALSAEDFDTLGPPLVDASHALEASVTEPGIVLRLEGRRLVLFGRSPESGEPGELPSALKWASLVRAIEDLRSGDPALDWSVVDVRWDRPSIERRAPLEAGSEGDRAGTHGALQEPRR